MKKTIGFLAIAITAISMAYNTGSVDENKDLASLLTLNTANAEGSAKVDCADVYGFGSFRMRKCGGSCSWSDVPWFHIRSTCTISW